MKFVIRQRRPPAINIVSLIDILTILLIFFIVTTTFKKEEQSMEIKLPESTTAEKTDQNKEPVIIYATKDQRIFLDKEEIKLKNLIPILKARKEKMKEPLFALKADKDVPLGFFVKVLDASTQAGLPNLSLFTDESKTENPQ
jgi:biopolymer transport protein ExbD